MFRLSILLISTIGCNTYVRESGAASRLPGKSPAPLTPDHERQVPDVNDKSCVGQFKVDEKTGDASFKQIYTRYSTDIQLTTNDSDLKKSLCAMVIQSGRKDGIQSFGVTIQNANGDNDTFVYLGVSAYGEPHEGFEAKLVQATQINDKQPQSGLGSGGLMKVRGKEQIYFDFADGSIRIDKMNLGNVVGLSFRGHLRETMSASETDVDIGAKEALESISGSVK